jgi:hypothetical protein
MSDEKPDNTPTAEPKPLGCLASFGSMGLAIYAILVLGLLVSSLTCGVMTMVNTWRSAHVPSSELQSGMQITPWRLTELRKWAVLTGNTTPALYHDHSEQTDGSSGCMVLADELILWNNKKLDAKLKIGGAELTGNETEVRMRQGMEEIVCPFWPGDGAERLLSMLKVDASLNPAPSPEPAPTPPVATPPEPTDDAQ